MPLSQERTPKDVKRGISGCEDAREDRTRIAAITADHLGDFLDRELVGDGLGNPRSEVYGRDVLYRPFRHLGAG